MRGIYPSQGAFPIFETIAQWIVIRALIIAAGGEV